MPKRTYVIKGVKKGAKKYLVEICYLKKQGMFINRKCKSVFGFNQSFSSKKEAKKFLKVFLLEDKDYASKNQIGLIDWYALRKIRK